MLNYKLLKHAGPSPDKASATLVLVHGRGADADSILSLYHEMALPQVAALAPSAPGRTWYPQSFLAPLEANQPYLDRALATLEEIVRELPAEQLVLLGFSQGACLALEFAARHPRPYGAVIGLTGGLIGPPGTPRDYGGDLKHTTVFLGSGDPDPHVPFYRVQETAQVFQRLGADVDIRRYPGLPHTINGDELEACRRIIESVQARRKS
jgi:predicted esterase